MTTQNQTQTILLQLVTDILNTDPMIAFLGTDKLGRRLADIHASLELRTNKLPINQDGKDVVKEMGLAMWRVTEFLLAADSPARLVLLNQILDSYAKGEIHYGEEHEDIMAALPPQF